MAMKCKQPMIWRYSTHFIFVTSQWEPFQSVYNNGVIIVMVYLAKLCESRWYYSYRWTDSNLDNWKIDMRTYWHKLTLLMHVSQQTCKSANSRRVGGTVQFGKSVYEIKQERLVQCPLAFEWCWLISPWTKWTPIWQTTISDAFCWMRMTEFRIAFHWNLFPGVQMTINQYWFRQWLGADQATSHCHNQCRPSSLMHICGTRRDEF